MNKKLKVTAAVFSLYKPTWLVSVDFLPITGVFMSVRWPAAGRATWLSGLL